MTTGTGRALFIVALAAALALVQGPTARAQQMNIIQAENQHEGTTDWILNDRSKGPNPPIHALLDQPYDQGWNPSTKIQGFCSHTSIRARETLRIFVSTKPAAEYTIDVYRLGYYGGTGGRHMTTLGPLQGQPQPMPEPTEQGTVECQWGEGVALDIPDDWVSGVYLGKLTNRDDGSQAYVVFILRDDREADLMFQCSDMTWQAYNRWPKWRSLYDRGEERWGANNRNPGYAISFDRPYTKTWNGLPAGYEPLLEGSGEFLLIEFPLAFWLEREGYDVTYISNMDLHVDPEGLRRAKAFLSVGHDEYWTREMFDNLTAARDQGLSIAFLSGNAVSGIVELLPSSDGRPNRIMRRVGQSFQDEHELMGATSYGVGFAEWTCDRPDHWLFEGTEMKKGDKVRDLVGWEYHGPPLREDPTLEIISSGPVFSGVRQGEVRERTYATTLYSAPNGNIVFNAATCWWNLPLSHPPGFINPPRFDFSEPDPRVQRITKNLLDRMISVDRVSGQ